MKEVELGRYAGPYKQPPYSNYIQSPVGLVPKDNGTKTRLIFHLSYDFGTEEHQKSVNHHTPAELCTVKYNDLDKAVEYCLELSQHLGVKRLYGAKTDLVSAFRLLPLLRCQRRFCVIKAEHPITGNISFFVEKNVSFGGSRSCLLFQKFSDCLKHLLEHRTGMKYRMTNYLDDFLFIAESEEVCNWLVRQFLEICALIGCPVSEEKTEWSSREIIFLGILLDLDSFTLAVPENKRKKALNLIKWVQARKSVTIGELQRLTGLLNFLNRAIFPGRAFTRRIYAKFSNLQDKKGNKLKQYHHVKVDKEMNFDLNIWKTFLEGFRERVLCRPFVDLHIFENSVTLQFFTDAAKSAGYGGYFNGRWFRGDWSRKFVQENNPSIEYLELFALCAGILTWQELLINCRVVVFCDNQSVRDIVNHTSAKCKNCMVLIRMLVLNGLVHNRRVFVKHIFGHKNELADSLSRGQMSRFWRLAPSHTLAWPDKIPEEMLPLNKLWLH